MTKPPSLLTQVSEFDERKRQALIFESAYQSYSRFFSARLLAVHRQNLIDNQENPEWMSGVYRAYAGDVYEFWQLRYTAGEDVTLLREEFEEVVSLFEERGKYEKTSRGDAFDSGFDLLYLDDYVCYVGMMSIAILLHRNDLLLRLHALMAGSEYDQMDALIEDLLAHYLPRRPYLETACQEEPYWRLLEVSAGSNPQEKLSDLKSFLKYWYAAMKPVAWYDAHRFMTEQGSRGYFGYWSWEAGAIAYLHDIDDSTITSMYYPKDLVAYARSLAPPPPAGTAAAMTGRLRCEAGHVCPHSGWWSTPALGHELRSFRQGALMPVIDSNSWGLTIWYFDQENQPGP